MRGPVLPPECRPLAALIALGCLGLVLTAVLTLLGPGTAPTGARDDIAGAGRFRAGALPHD